GDRVRDGGTLRRCGARPGPARRGVPPPGEPVARARHPAGPHFGRAPPRMRIIAGEWRGRSLAAPPGRQTRPTTDRVREAWLSALQFDLPDSRVLDLFAGSGALGLEALSRGAQSVTFVERGAPALRAL